MNHAVKAVGEYSLRGRGIVYGGTDLAGDTFTKNTDLGASRSFEGLPVYYDHALSGLKSQIGVVKYWEADDEGIEVEIELDRRHKYAKEVMELVKRGGLGLSTGSLPHLVVRKDGELKRWVVGEISLTPTPAEPRTLTEVKSQETETVSTAAVDVVPDDIVRPSAQTDTNKSISFTGETTTMSDIKNQVKEAIAELAGEPVESGVIAAPAAKSVTSRGFSNEPMEAFRHYLKTGEVIKAVINEGTSSEGGIAVPKELIPTIVGRRDELSLLGQFNFRRFTTSVRQVDIPVQDAKADFAVVAESGAANQDEPDFGNSRTITVYRYNMLMKVTNEFLADQQANFDQFITEEIARAYARLVNNYIINGTGSSQPYGILARATTSETLAAVAGLDFADVLNIMHKLPSAYDEAGSTGWIMRNSTLGAIRALVGDYPQFRPMVNGTAKDLEGYKVALSDKIAALGASAKPIIFGNFNEYAFVENATIEVVRNPYLYMANNQTGIFVNVRWGGDVLQPEAFVYGVNPAS